MEVIEIKQEEIDQLKEDLEIANLQLQAVNDTLDGNITSMNMASFRNTYVVNASDSLDATHPMYVYFNVLEETIKIVSVKVSYWIHKYRAYSTANANSSVLTSGAFSGLSGYRCTEYNDGTRIYIVMSPTGSLVVPLLSDYALISQHTHTVPAHAHNVIYGIHEEDTTPVITFSVSQDGGVGYGVEYGKVAIDRLLIDITDSITTAGSKIIKLEATTRTRLTVQVEIKLDIKVR